MPPLLADSIPVDVEGAQPTLLTAEAADHEAKFSPDGRHFVDCFSRADLPTVAVLRLASTGQVLLRLESADLAPLLKTGWTLPQPFVTTAPDGSTPLYSLLWAPHGMTDNNKQPEPGSVPVLENICPSQDV